MIDEINNESVPESDFSTTASIDDLLAEEEEGYSPQPTTLRTGVGGNQKPDPVKNDVINPNAARFLFNPFETIDVRNEPAGCGFGFIENVVFHKVKSLDTNVGKTDTYNLPETGHNAENYDQFRRTAYMIATELINKHGDKGVIIVSPLTGQSDEIAGQLNTLLFGNEVTCVTDPNDDDHPCPVLPTLLEDLDANARQLRASDTDPSSKASIAKTVREVRNSIMLAMRNARTRIDQAQKRMLDEKNPNRSLSHAEQRCYLALGLEIPNQMPFLTRSAVAGVNNSAPAGAIDYEAIGRGVAAGMHMQQAAAVPAPSVQTPQSEPVTSFEVDENDIETAETAEIAPTLEQVKVSTGKSKNRG